MHRWVHHWHQSDTLFTGWVVLTLLLVGLYLSFTPGPEKRGDSSGRHIDMQTFKTRLEQGELSDHRALWYHPQEKPG